MRSVIDKKLEHTNLTDQSKSEIKKSDDSLYNELESGIISADVYYAELIKKMHQLI